MADVLVDFIEIDNSWDKKVTKHAFDIYHLSGWINASIEVDKGRPQGITAKYNGKEFFLPIIIRVINDTYWDAISPYGYGGPVIDSALTQYELELILSAIKHFLYQKGCVSLFIRLNPILNKECFNGIGTMVTQGYTLISDLSKSKEQHWLETQKQHRRGINKALKNNIITKFEDFTEDRISIFAGIYKETMTKVQAASYYHFKNDYFYELSKQMQDRLLMITAYEDDIAIASSLYTICKESGIMHFHLGGTLNHYRNLQPSKLITHTAREWGRKNGYSVLHFGGGLGCRSDSLYEYKRGFSSEELTFKTWRLIINIKKYIKLVEAHSGLTEVGLETGFFPLYRDPSVSAQSA